VQKIDNPGIEWVTSRSWCQETLDFRASHK